MASLHTTIGFLTHKGMFVTDILVFFAIMNTLGVVWWVGVAVLRCEKFLYRHVYTLAAGLTLVLIFTIWYGTWEQYIFVFTKVVILIKDAYRTGARLGSVALSHLHALNCMAHNYTHLKNLDYIAYNHTYHIPPLVYTALRGVQTAARSALLDAQAGIGEWQEQAILIHFQRLHRPCLEGETIDRQECTQQVIQTVKASAFWVSPRFKALDTAHHCTRYLDQHLTGAHVTSFEKAFTALKEIHSEQDTPERAEFVQTVINELTYGNAFASMSWKGFENVVSAAQQRRAREQVKLEM